MTDGERPSRLEIEIPEGRASATALWAPADAVLVDPVVAGAAPPAPVVRLLIERASSLGSAYGAKRLLVILHAAARRTGEVAGALESLGLAEEPARVLLELYGDASESHGPEPSWRLSRETEAALVVGLLAGTLSVGQDARQLALDLEARCRANDPDVSPAWIVAWDGAEPVGLVLPGFLDEERSLAGSLHVGVVPSRRRRGLGRALQLASIRSLRERGAIRFVSSTESDNVAMLRILERLGYRVRDLQRIFQRPLQRSMRRDEG